MNKITQKQINDAADLNAKLILKNSKSPDTGIPEALLSEFFKRAIKWYRMAEIENNSKDYDHPDNPNISIMTSSDTFKAHVDNHPEILEWLRINYKHQYSIYADAITVFSDWEKDIEEIYKEINKIRSV